MKPDTGKARQGPALPPALTRDIARLVEHAKIENRTLHTGVEARRLEDRYPECRIAHDDLCEEILVVAMAARVPTQINSAF